MQWGIRLKITPSLGTAGAGDERPEPRVIGAIIVCGTHGGGQSTRHSLSSTSQSIACQFSCFGYVLDD